MPGPNPYRGAKANVIYLGDYLVPGFVMKISDASRKFEWTVQKGTSTSGATTVYKGEKLCEGIKVLLEAPDEASFDSLYDFRDMVYPLPGQKPPTFAVDNFVFAFAKIGRVSLGELGQPECTSTNSWTLEVTFIEFKPPSPTAAGPADPAKPGDDGNDPKAPTINAAAAKAGKIVMAKSDE